MANSLKLYVDTQNNKLVQSDTDASDFTLPTFFQGDVLAVELKLLEPNTTGGLTTPFNVISTSYTVKVAIGTPDASSSTVHTNATLTFSSSLSQVTCSQPSTWCSPQCGHGQNQRGLSLAFIDAFSLQRLCQLVKICIEVNKRTQRIHPHIQRLVSRPCFLPHPLLLSVLYTQHSFLRSQLLEVFVVVSVASMFPSLAAL